MTAATLITWTPSAAWKREMGALLAARGQSRQRPGVPCLPGCQRQEGFPVDSWAGPPHSEATRSCCSTALNKAAAGATKSAEQAKWTASAS